jgi:hypothetical protein
MKNLLTTILILFCLTGSAQIGGNYVNLDTYGDSLSMVWMCEASDYIVPVRLRTDKEQSPVLDVATLDKAKQFHRIAKQLNKKAQFCYTVNLWASPEINLQGITELINYGCDVPVIEVGNEYYSWIKKDYGKIDFSYYQPKAEALRNVVSAAYPSLIFVYPACPSPKGSGISPERQDHKDWNEALKVMLDKYPNDSYVWHVYYDSYDAPVLADAEKGLTKQKYTDSQNTYLADFYGAYYTGCVNSTLFDKSFNYADSLFKRKGYFTEYGTVGSGNIRNTYTYGLLVFRDGVKWKEKTNLYVHAGISLTGVIQPKNSKFDPLTINTNNVRRVEYLALKMANECINAKPLQENNELKEGVNYFYFTDLVTASFTGNFNVEFETHYISGKYLYSTGGATAFMANGSTRTQEITGVTVVEGYDIPVNSFGYVKVTCTPIEIPGCTKPEATNYNELANVDDGSCAFDVYGCTSKDATNYNPLATKDDGSCEYQTVCYKKRWLFSGCKLDKNCSVNNCK